MKNFISIGLVAAICFLALFKSALRAQEPERKPIPEVPDEPEEVRESIRVVEEKPKEATPMPEKAKAEPEVRKTEAVVIEDEPVSIEDTLFAPAKPGQGIQSSDIPASSANEPVDASTIAIAAKAPKDDQVQLLQIYEGLRQWENAIAAGNLVLKRDPNNLEALAGMSRIMVETGRSTEALNYAERLIKLQPGMKSNALKAAALMSAARVEEAEALLLQMKAKHKGSTPFLYESLLGFAKLDQAKKKEARSIFEAIENNPKSDPLEIDTASKQLLLMDLDHAVEWRDIDKAKAAVAELRADYKGEPETAAAEAVEMFLDGNSEEAAGRLASLRSEFPRLRLYPFLLQLANFSYAAGDLDNAEAAYAEALADPRTRPLDREAIIRNRAQLRIREGEEVSLSQGITDGDEGSLSTTSLKVRKGVNEHWYFGAEVTRQDINLDGNSAVRGDDDRLEGALVAERRLKKGRYAEVKVGGSEEGVMGSVTVGKRARVYSDAWSVGIAGNERADDSAQLAALNGRQHRISGTYQYEINPRTVISAEAIIRQVDVDGAKLGTGAGAEAEIAYRLNEEERKMNYFVAWRSAYTKFNRSGFSTRGSAFDQAVVEQLSRDEVLEGLVQSEFGRHGVELRHEGQWREALFTRAIAGLYYRSDTSDVEVSAGVGLDWFFKEDMRLFFDALYTSSGRAGNSGSGAVEAKVGLAKSF